ncbi:hypothetical protein HJG60_011505 [Phyllostomus discolor]|uniref:Uncharacterized protein n=1 Tax=Phyllostomus discolor TaxID=89673 RepID=A0A833ZNN2_9CHIR|nr:hypothetical protein HJG60_011505 [Phyllostomus discolor]
MDSLIYSPRTVTACMFWVKNPKFRGKAPACSQQVAEEGGEPTSACPAPTHYPGSPAGGGCRRMFCKAPTRKRSHLSPETSCKYAQAKQPSSFLFQPAGSLADRPEGQDSPPHPTHSFENRQWPNGTQGSICLPFSPGSSEGAGRGGVFIEHLLYVWQVLKYKKIECPGPGTCQGMKVSPPCSCLHFKDILTGGTAQLLRAPATKSDRRQVWGWGGRSSSASHKMGDLGQVT